MIDVDIKSITVNKSRINCVVVFPSIKFSDANIKNLLIKNRPTLVSHKCKNKNSQAFVDVLAQTSMPHILEHLIIDYQIEYANKSNIFGITLLGSSEWLDKSFGLAKIEFQYFDDIVAIKSINNSVNLLKKIQP